MLNDMRLGELDDHAIRAFRKLSRPLHYEDGIGPTQLYQFPPFLKPNVFDSLADTQPELKLTAQMNQDFARFQAKQYSTMPPMFQVLIQMAFGYLNNRWRDC